MQMSIRMPRPRTGRDLIVPLGPAALFASGLACFGDPSPSFEGDVPGECSDGADNDRDGTFDCADVNCEGAPNCAPATTPSIAAAPAAAPAPQDPSSARGHSADGRITTVGSCQDTRVSTIGPRLLGTDFSTGVAVSFENGINIVDYDPNPIAVAESVGDAVTVCLVSIPENCPPGDDRGRVYSVLDHRQGKSYTMADSQHMCGGA